MGMPTRRVLVVDDSPTMRQLILFALQQIRGLQVDEAGDGVAALKMLASNEYDLLLTDINMPVMDGMKLIGLLRNDEKYNELPIVVITTEGSTVDRDKATALGANEYLTKPIRTAPLLELASRLLNGHQ